MLEFQQFTADGRSFSVSLFVFFVGAAALSIIDVSQIHEAVRRNYPVIERFRHQFSTQGKFFFGNISSPWIASKCSSTKRCIWSAADCDHHSKKNFASFDRLIEE